MRTRSLTNILYYSNKSKYLTRVFLFWVFVRFFVWFDFLFAKGLVANTI